MGWWYIFRFNFRLAKCVGILQIRSFVDQNREKMWHPIRACFRYVTNAPWKRIPVRTKTLVMNKIVACLAGGRNKTVAHRYTYPKHSNLKL